MTAADFSAQILHYCRLLDKGVIAHHKAQLEAAEAETDFKREAAAAFLVAEGPVAEREARAEEKVTKLRYEYLVKAALAKSALEALRARQSQLSALQTVAGAYKEEARLGRTRPD